MVSEVARAHGVTPQQLFGWRREARRKAEATEGLSVCTGDCRNACRRPFVRASKSRQEPCLARPHNIELDIEGASVWIWRGADAAMVTSIIGALKAGK